MKTTTRTILALLLPFFLAACSSVGADSAQYETHVLFIGNSHTFHNDVPKMFESMARAGGHSVKTDMIAHGGWTLLDHAQSAETTQKIRSEEWDYIVLQEQGDVPSFSSSREQEMYPAIRGLHNEISARGAETVLFMTWGHRDGSLAEGVGGYNAESAVVENTYVKIGNELDVAIAPVGVAWWTAMRSNPNLDLWVDDGNHATKGRKLPCSECPVSCDPWPKSWKKLLYSRDLRRLGAVLPNRRCGDCFGECQPLEPPISGPLWYKAAMVGLRS